MASQRVVAQSLVDVFGAAHTAPTPAESVLYAKVLAGVADDELEAAVARLVAGEKWEFAKKPSPALVLEWVGTERAARRAKEPPKPPAPPTPPAVVAQAMAQVRAARTAGARARLKEQA